MVEKGEGTGNHVLRKTELRKPHVFLHKSLDLLKTVCHEEKERHGFLCVLMPFEGPLGHSSTPLGWLTEPRQPNGRTQNP